MKTQRHAIESPEPEITIRPVDMEDVPALCPLWPHRTQDEVHHLVKRILKQQHQKRGLGVVLMFNKELVGYGQFTLWNQKAEIADLAVLEGYRSRGYGTQLIEHLLRTARRGYATHAEIGVEENNPRALALYKHLGFEPFHTFQVGTGENINTVIYLQLALR